MQLLDSYKTELALLKQFIEEEEKRGETERVAKTLAEVFQNKGKVLICGNGGSNCDAMHFAEEFTGRFRKERPALPAISLSDSSHITCVGNDYGFDYIFSKGVEAYGQEGDFFIGISTSGNSPNVIEAVKTAKERKLKTLALLGKDGGKLKGMCDYEFIIPGETSDRIQEIHMMILHIIIEGVERILFPENYMV
ncbi:phosphoheptose isomerase [Fusobacterium necrophorum subsp. funduliforme]|uniref:Phosphoheptose isomerase n=3 Tax=Fusobacterium necrophorum TaxID=859 RepID=A0AAN3VTI2_9FUSO|nr:D-sedoheptulose 7-phosphate isomerase [Fusobacterium necrophorum]AYV93447.1 D-sedoheptulose 7-phosphate isomerase [Fusobacterium necrophorum subsp. funduliforme]AYV95571.1 D-sedoheptulose 7-phosphate isomerase [Fusobacterium necrophorum subsp. funduliforme]EIJ67062.1 phosphoheptose isomerase [Fusobacterium necrophorum subsp. funduliforme ATCC 51357]EJU15186.1 phosphoheptose isomerase [Fusobacterium necrophorum subsp. funduliforme Fnf 1007]KAB0552785.1 D-sedoheptulose 7-phosphate isomerase [